MDIIKIIEKDYQNFPHAQSYGIYAEDVYFADPLTKFRGIKRYEKMIGFMTTWFKELELTLVNIHQENQLITTRWSLSWNTPLPWYPRIKITGRSELKINEDNLIVSHVDYWDCSPLDVLKQHFNF